MVLTDRVNTFSITKCQEEAEPVWNANQVVTIGGNVKSQADSQRLKINISMRLTQAQLASLSAIVKNFSQTLYYTPGRLLYDKSSIAEMIVTCNAPSIEKRAYNGGIIYQVSLELNEVINTSL
jgi:hypothetical protein